MVAIGATESRWLTLAVVGAQLSLHLKPQASALLLALEPCRGLGGVPGFGVEASMHTLPAGLPIVLGDITQVSGPQPVRLWCLQRSGSSPIFTLRGPSYSGRAPVHSEGAVLAGRAISADQL